MTTRADIYRFRLESVYPFDSLKVAPAADAVIAILRSAGHLVEPCSLYDEVIRGHELGRRVKETGRSSFNVTFPSAAALLGRVRNFNHSFLALDLEESLDWGFAVEACAGLAPIVCARLVDCCFDYWQNAEDPLQYRAAGRPVDGLPMKSNNLPPPLDQMIVDTSRNPGRRVLRDGYVEAVGHRMWIGPEFFRRVPGASREAVASAPWLRVSEHPSGILETVASDDLFVDTSTADVQIRLRRLLFPTTADAI